MKVKIELTWSKIVAVLVLVAAVWLDLVNGGNSSFMFALPFISALIGLKQYLDGRLKKPNRTGCTDPLANNFDAEATIDDGSCKYNAAG